jgi:hypothetical protein
MHSGIFDHYIYNLNFLTTYVPNTDKSDHFRSFHEIQRTWPGFITVDYVIVTAQYLQSGLRIWQFLFYDGSK